MADTDTLVERDDQQSSIQRLTLPEAPTDVRQVSEFLTEAHKRWTDYRGDIDSGIPDPHTDAIRKMLYTELQALLSTGMIASFRQLTTACDIIELLTRRISMTTEPPDPTQCAEMLLPLATFLNTCGPK
jgi:hypothetical protein